MKKWKEGALTVYMSDGSCLPFFSKWDQYDWKRDVMYLVTREDGLGIMRFIAICLLPARWAVSVDLKEKYKSCKVMIRIVFAKKKMCSEGR